MGPESLHMTTLEVAHSRSEKEITDLLYNLEPRLEEITDFTYDHRAQLVKPMLCFDASAIALSFVPATEDEAEHVDESYTYLHLRRDILKICQETGIRVASRYVLPSCHLTIGRFVNHRGLSLVADDMGQIDPLKVRGFLNVIDSMNEWLRQEYWAAKGDSSSGGAWIVGSEKGLECRKGTLWYGDGGETVRLGKGF